MRICIIGKFPPIQGGVSARTYLAAHGLAMRGHEVHVVTNAKEAVAPFRMFMRAQDWDRCEAAYGAGSVAVHWTDPVDRTQAHIPQSPSFVTKLATLAARAHAKVPFDVIFSFYMEPYGVAGHLAAQMTGVPHVARMAGSDAGRLWHHPQFELAYDHVLRSAAAVIMGGAVAERAVERGIPAERIAPAGGVVLPADLFAPDGPRLDVAEIRAAATADPQLRDLMWGGFAADRPFFGVYGKLGELEGNLCAARRDGAAQALRNRCRAGRARAWRHGGRSSLPRHAPPNSALRTASCKSRFCRTGVSRNSCAAAWRCAASSRAFRSPSMPR